MKLVAFDFDGTLSDSEMTVLLGRREGVADEMATITERAMNDELSYAESLRERAALLEGLEEELARDWPDQHHVTARVDGGDSRSILAVCRVGQPGSADGPSLPDVDVERIDGGVRIDGDVFSGEVTLSGSPSIQGTVHPGDGTERLDLP